MDIPSDSELFVNASKSEKLVRFVVRSLLRVNTSFAFAIAARPLEACGEVLAWYDTSHAMSVVGTLMQSCK